VGIDLPPMRAGQTPEDEQDEYNPTAELPAIPRRRLAPVVIGAVGACALILLAAGAAQLTRSDTDSANAAAQTTVTIASKPASTATSNAATARIPAPPPAPAPAPSPAAKSPFAATTPADAADAPSTGTILFAHPGKVWLDGKRLTGTSALVRCGSHRIKLGLYAKSRAIDVPCGGEVTVKK
jgi:hypothetical protein